MKKIINKKEFEVLAKGVISSIGQHGISFEKEYKGYFVKFFVFNCDIYMNVLSYDEGSERKFSIGLFEFETCDHWVCEKFQAEAEKEFNKIISEYEKVRAEAEQPSESSDPVPAVEDVINPPAETEQPAQIVESITYNNRKEQAHAYTDAIRKELSISCSAQLATAFLIKTVYAKKLFDVYGYDNIYDYAKEEFNVARGTTSNWLKVAQNFSVYLPEKDMHVLDSRLQDYTITQLILLRGLKIEQILEYGFTPDLTCKQIKDKLSVLNLHITKGAAVPQKQVAQKSENEPENEPENDYYVEEDAEKYLYEECTENTAKEPRAKLTFTVKGGTTLMDTQIAVLQQMVQKEAGKTFEIKVFIKQD